MRRSKKGIATGHMMMERVLGRVHGYAYLRTEQKKA